MTKTYLGNSEEDGFNESLTTLSNSPEATSMQKGKPKQQVIALIGALLDEKWEKVNKYI